MTFVRIGDELVISIRAMELTSMLTSHIAGIALVEDAGGAAVEVGVVLVSLFSSPGHSVEHMVGVARARSQSSEADTTAMEVEEEKVVDRTGDTTSSGRGTLLTWMALAMG